MTAAVRKPGMRVLPLAIVALVALLALKLAGLGSEAWTLLGPGVAHASSPAPADAPPAAPAPENHSAEPAAKDPAAMPEQGPTASESDVLERLGERRQQLDARERDLDMREKLIGAAEKRIEERIAELKTIEARIEESFGKRDEEEEKKLASLVKMYETMKPGDAAEIFNTLEIGVLLDVVSRMKPAKASPIVAAMKPERAQEITVELARRKTDPGLAEAPMAAPATAPGG